MKSSSQKRRLVLPETFDRLYLSACFVAVIHVVFAASAIAIDRQQILSAGKVQGGVMIHLGCRDASLLAEFAQDSRFAAQGLTSGARLTNRLRASLAGKKLSGKASVQTSYGAQRPYVDHLVRFLIVER
jgi:hypothetical protein